MTPRELLRSTTRRRRSLLALAGWALLGALPTLVSGQAVARAVDDGFLADRPATGLAWLGVLAATVPLGAFGARQSYLGVARLVEPLRDELVHLVVAGSVRRAAETGERDGGAVGRLTQHVEIVRDTCAGLFLLLLSFVAAIVAALVGLLTLAPVVVVLVAPPLLLACGAFAASLPSIARRQRRLLLADEALAEQAQDVVAGLRDVVACGGEATVERSLARAVDEQVAAGEAMAKVNATRTLIVAVGARLPLVVVLVSAGWLLRRGLSEGALLGTLTYLVQGLGPAVASVVGGIGAPLAQLLVVAERLVAVDAAGPRDSPPTVLPADAALKLHHVTFRYRTAAEPLINRLDLDIEPGDHLAVVGPSGVGKSTLALLLVGALSPQEGTIRHDGHDPLDVDASGRVLIPQEAYLFRGSVDENIRYLHPEASAAQRDEAIAAVGVGDLVARIGGVDADLDPSRLSAGERQLIALARAYLSPAPLVVLDEATCHLDPPAEAEVEAAFRRRPGTTLVVVAHRLSSARRAGRVLLMDGPNLMVGTHDELVERSPAYRELVGHWVGPVAWSSTTLGNARATWPCIA